MSFQSSFCNWAEYRVHLQFSVYFYVLLVVFASASFTCILGRYAAFWQLAWVFRGSGLVITVVCICICICILLQLEQVVLVRWAVGVFSRAPECARRPGQRLCLLVSTPLLHIFSSNISEIRKWEEKVVLFMSAPRPPPNHVFKMAIFHSKSQTVI